MKKIITLFLMFVGSYAGGFGKSFAPATDPLYLKECASCHFAYQPALLPKASWQEMMKNLQNHFGVDASLDEEDAQKILQYLTDNALENSNSKRARKIRNSLQAGVIYPSIQKIPYFERKHRKIPPYMIEQKEVKSLARCNACHKEAQNGNYDDKTVNIPNYGYFND
ncbi:hypothetical protein HpCK38_18560 [Helicobacter pylori]